MKILKNMAGVFSEDIKTRFNIQKNGKRERIKIHVFGCFKHWDTKVKDTITNRYF